MTNRHLPGWPGPGRGWERGRPPGSAAGRSTRCAASDALARTLQDSLLPPRLPDTPGLDVAAVHPPATATGTGTATGRSGAEVTGDFRNALRTAGDNWCVVLGDVCGKGVDAPKVTAPARYTVRAEATQRPQPVTVPRRPHEAMTGQ